MKYKNIELELPPLGEIRAVLEDDGGCCIGHYNLDDKKRVFRKYHTIFFGTRKYDYYDFVLFSHISNLTNCRGYVDGENVKEMTLEKRNKDGKTDSWIERKIYKED